MNCATIVVAHKPTDIPLLEGYLPIKVGNLDFELEGSVRDNTGDNISKKNPNYCELTALYWFWKNWNKPYEYIGLAHYRRFLRV